MWGVHVNVGVDAEEQKLPRLGVSYSLVPIHILFKQDFSKGGVGAPSSDLYIYGP